MASYEPDELLSCSDCGAAVATDLERLYSFGTDSLLCMECALRRGGGTFLRRYLHEALLEGRVGQGGVPIQGLAVAAAEAGPLAGRGSQPS